MTNPTGAWIWYELMTPDAAGAAKFYGDVVGWTVEANPSSPAGAPEYRQIGRRDGGSAGGMMTITTEMTAGGMRAAWVGYLYAADVAKTIEAIKADGGSVLMPPMTIPVGVIAMVADPQGAPFYVMTPKPPADRPNATSDVFSITEPQHVRWNELSTEDPDAAVKFYRRHFGWTQEGHMDMGALGKYLFIQHGGVRIGAVMPRMPGSPANMWRFYIGVDDIDRAMKAVVAGGGKIARGPDEIPGGEFSLSAADPQGAGFCLVGPRAA